MRQRLILVTAVGEASGSKAAAAALACAGSETDRPGLLIDIGGRPPRPTLVASSAARELEERFAVHLPHLRAASRGETCHLAVPADGAAFETVAAALPLVRDSVAVLHLAAPLLQAVLSEPRIELSGVLLRADLDPDRALIALAARDLISLGLRVAVLKRPLGWVPSRRALFGAASASAPGGLPARVAENLLQSQNSMEHRCYDGENDEKIDPEGAAQQQRRGDEGVGRGRGLHRYSQRAAGR